MLLMAPWVTNSSVYGKCQLWKASKRAGIDIGWEQTARIMRELGIHCPWPVSSPRFWPPEVRTPRGDVEL